MRIAGSVAIVILAVAPILAATNNWRISWHNIVTEDEGCFYFSGPDGRDNKLVGEASIVRDGDMLAIHIGKAVFRGTVNDSGFAVTRQSRHDYNGPWDVTERITGTSLQNPVRARYRYNECEVGTRCPGKCTIDAGMVFTR
jgi:hypothetical protein